MTLEPKICAFPDCSVTFVPRRSSQKYHDPAEGAAMRNRRLSGTPSPTDDIVNAVERGVYQQEIENLRSELALYDRQPVKSPPWLRIPKSSKGHRGTLVAFASDLHYGEVVRAEEMGGYNAYNLAIAEQRTRRFFERTILVARAYLAGVSYDGIVLALGGDLVSGDIHDELTETNEVSTYETVEIALPWLKAGVEMFAEEFGNVHVVSAPGNHGRNSRKPRSKKRADNNADTHLSRLLANQFDGVDGVTFDVPRSIDVDFDVYGYRFTMEHGDQAKGGDGQVGALGPVKRLTLRKQMQAAEEGHPFKYLLVGHFHQFVPAHPQGFVMNGSLKGYDEYARAWHFKPEPPQQALMVVTPEHGVSVTAPVYVRGKTEKW